MQKEVILFKNLLFACRTSFSWVKPSFFRVKSCFSCAKKKWFSSLKIHFSRVKSCFFNVKKSAFLPKSRREWVGTRSHTVLGFSVCSYFLPTCSRNSSRVFFWTWEAPELFPPSAPPKRRSVGKFRVGMWGMGWSYLLLVFNGILDLQNVGILEPNPAGGWQGNCGS